MCLCGYAYLFDKAANCRPESNSLGELYLGRGMRVCVSAVCVRACVCAGVHARVCASVGVIRQAGVLGVRAGRGACVQVNM